jgi:hypothetical protein
MQPSAFFPPDNKQADATAKGRIDESHTSVLAPLASKPKTP